MSEKFTLSEIISRVNVILNYPAVTYEDLYAFFDMAIAELNTTLHTDLKSVTNMINEFRQISLKQTSNRVLITEEPDSTTTIPEYGTVEDFLASTAKYAYINTLNTYVIANYNRTSYTSHDILYGIYNDISSVTYYKALRYSADSSFWALDNSDNPLELNVLEYLTEDWITLYIIPYVCFKYTCRDGGTATVFAEEFTQGFQQLQESYDVPEFVTLSEVANLLAYRTDVEENLPYLNIKVPTKAITKVMKHKRQLNARFGNMYDRGGFYD